MANNVRTFSATANANLALVKYWGKANSVANLPATSSIGITLEALSSETQLSLRSPRLSPRSNRSLAVEMEAKTQSAVGSTWLLRVNGIEQSPSRFAPFFEELGKLASSRGIRIDKHFDIESTNNFPTGAGLASSASGFAALAKAFDSALGLKLSPEELSSLARIGSASASRSIFAGFVVLPAGAYQSHQIYDASHWPDLRCIIVVISSQSKYISSRKAMKRAEETSPYYSTWLQSSEQTYRNALSAIRDKDLEKLGNCMQQSYLGMFSTMFTSYPPIIYWKPETLAVISLAEELRSEGIPVFETMDAGPQVKFITNAEYAPKVLQALEEHCNFADCIVSKIAQGIYHAR